MFLPFFVSFSIIFIFFSDEVIETKNKADKNNTPNTIQDQKKIPANMKKEISNGMYLFEKN